MPVAPFAAPHGSEADPLLWPLLHPKSESSARDYLDRLIRDHADPIIAAAIRRYMPGPFAVSSGAAADVREETVYRLLLCFDTSRADKTAGGRSAPIRDFHAYVRTAAQHACWNHQRKRRMETLASGLTRFGDANETLCLDDALPAPGSVSQIAISREMLNALWEEIACLPSQQRMALLLHLRSPDRTSGFAALATAVKASPQKMADLLGLCPTELAELLPLLPMADKEIGERVGLPVVALQNLRIAARRRLQRRLRDWLTEN